MGTSTGKTTSNDGKFSNRATAQERFALFGTVVIP